MKNIRQYSNSSPERGRPAADMKTVFEFILSFDFVSLKESSAEKKSGMYHLFLNNYLAGSFWLASFTVCVLVVYEAVH